MPRNGSGDYSLPAGNPVSTGTTISSTWANNTLSDVGTALTQSVSKDGQTAYTGNQPMGGNRHTNVGNATARNEYATLGQVQDSAGQYVTSVSGTNTITGSVTGLNAYVAGQTFRLLVANTNTGAVTLNINGLGAISVVKNVSTALTAGEIVAGQLLELTYDGTNFQIVNFNTVLNDGSLTIQNVSDNTKKVRFSAANQTTGTTRVLSTPDRNVSLVGADLLEGVTTSTSAPNTYTASMSYNPTAYVTNGVYIVRFTNANTSTTPTINLNGIGAVTIVRQGGGALYIGDISAGMYAELQYNGTAMVLRNPAIIVPTRFVSTNQTITSAGTLTIAHGLPGTPTKLWYGLVNTSPEYGWNGEELFQSFAPQDASATVARGATAWADATNVYVQYGSGAAVFNVHQKTGTPGLTSAATNTNWRLKVYAEL